MVQELLHKFKDEARELITNNLRQEVEASGALNAHSHVVVVIDGVVGLIKPCVHQVVAEESGKLLPIRVLNYLQVRNLW